MLQYDRKSGYFLKTKSNWVLALDGRHNTEEILVKNRILSPCPFLLSCPSRMQHWSAFAGRLVNIKLNNHPFLVFFQVILVDKGHAALVTDEGGGAVGLNQVVVSLGEKKALN